MSLTIPELSEIQLLIDRKADRLVDRVVEAMLHGRDSDEYKAAVAASNDASDALTIRLYELAGIAELAPVRAKEE